MDKTYRAEQLYHRHTSQLLPEARAARYTRFAAPHFPLQTAFATAGPRADQHSAPQQLGSSLSEQAKRLWRCRGRCRISCHPGSALSFHRKYRRIFNSPSPVLQITIWKEGNYSPSFDVTSFLRKKPSIEDRKISQRIQKRIFRIQQRQNTLRRFRSP